MPTNHLDAPSTGSKPAAPANQPATGSPARLIILLGLLAIALGALGYDYFMARPGVEAADKKLEKFVEERNKMGVKDAALVTQADVQKELGMKPTWVEEDDEVGYTVEYYSWWGKVPRLSKQRHFLAVVYVGSEPRRYSAHYREKPPEEAFPIINQPASAETSEPLESPTAATPGGQGSGKKSAAKEELETPAESPTKDDKAAADKQKEDKD